MHSPIIYIVKDKELIYDLDKPEEKQLFMDEVYSYTAEEEFDRFVPNSDWWVTNTVDDEGWHRGEWDVLQLVIKELERLTDREHTPKEVKNGVFEFTITPDDALRYQQYLADSMKEHITQLENADREDINQLSTANIIAYYRIKDVFESVIKITGFDEDYVYVRTFMDYFDTAMYQDKDVTFYLYTKMQGDYHY